MKIMVGSHLSSLPDGQTADLGGLRTCPCHVTRLFNARATPIDQRVYDDGRRDE
jgi:hypothetical protein